MAEQFKLLSYEVTKYQVMYGNKTYMHLCHTLCEILKICHINELEGFVAHGVLFSIGGHPFLMNTPS